MSNFNNNAYQSLVADLIGDTFYKDISWSSGRNSCRASTSWKVIGQRSS